MFTMNVTLCGSHELDVLQNVEVHISFPRLEVKWYLSICVDVTLICALKKMMTQDEEQRFFLPVVQNCHQNARGLAAWS